MHDLCPYAAYNSWSHEFLFKPKSLVFTMVKERFNLLKPKFDLNTYQRDWQLRGRVLHISDALVAELMAGHGMDEHIS